MNRLFFCAALVSIGLGCREQLPETPGLELARQERTAGPSKPAPRRLPETTLRAKLTGGTPVFQDNFERSQFGPKWRLESRGWRITEGGVTNTSARNKGVWLLEKLPQGDLRIEFSVTSTAFEKTQKDGQKKRVFPGDIKCEAFNKEPTHQTGYIFIFGGWNNTVNRIARLEEHGTGPGAHVADGKRLAVKADHAYRMKIVRIGNTMAWFADDQLLVQMTDGELIRGAHFGFNNWEAHLRFDDLAVYSLPDKSKPAPVRHRSTGTPHQPAGEKKKSTSKTGPTRPL